jgi:hypothetical protein
MYCREAQYRLTQFASDPNGRVDVELMEHLDQCLICAREAQSEALLSRALQEASAEADHSLPTLASTRTAVERRLHNRTLKWPSFRPAWLQGRLQLTFGVVAVAMIAVFALVPFHYQRTIGYEVAVAGVNKDLAMDTEKLDLILERLGVAGADVQVTGCESTCVIRVCDLKSEDDGRIVLAAFGKLGGTEAPENLKAVRAQVHGSLLELCRENVQAAGVTCIPDSEVQQIIIQRLGSEFATTLNVTCVTSCPDSMKTNCIGADGQCKTVTVECVDSGGPNGCVVVQTLTLDSTGEYELADGRKLLSCSISDDESLSEILQKAGVNLADIRGYLDDETIRKLEARGVTVQRETPQQLSTAAVEEAAAPVNSALLQNYPNPFNPTTTIEFNVPSRQHVSLTIYNVLGQTVRTLIDDEVEAGDHLIEWNGETATGAPAASGTYLYKLETSGYTETRQMTLLK